MKSNESAETVISPLLDPEERVLWFGQPITGLRLRPQDAYIIPFSLLWCGFAIAWETSAIRQGSSVFFMLWGMPFISAGLFLVFGRFFWDAASRAKTWYAVTDQRLILLTGLFSRQTRSLQLQNLPEISLNERRDGNGTIVFGSNPGVFPFSQTQNRQPVSPSFDLIQQAREVSDIIRRAQKAAFHS